MNASIQLDSAATAKVLESAVRTQAQVVLEWPHLEVGTVNGFLISADDRALLMEMTGRLCIKPADLVMQACEVHLYMDQRYVFAATVTAAPQWGESRSLALTRPSMLRVLDRRRFFRARLARSSRVTLEWNVDGSQRRVTAPLLNISVDGLACRMDQEAAQSIKSSEVLKVIFELPDQPRPFNLVASLCNKTAATDGFVILGLQFSLCAQSAEGIADLRTALAGSNGRVSTDPVLV